MASKNIIKVGNIEIEQLEIAEDLLAPQYPILIKVEGGKYNNTELVVKIDDLETTVTADICSLPKNKVVINNDLFPGLQKYLESKKVCENFGDKVKCNLGTFDVVDVSKFGDPIDMSSFFS